MSNLHLFRTKADERIKELELALKQIERKAARICMNDSCVGDKYLARRILFLCESVKKGQG